MILHNEGSRQVEELGKPAVELCDSSWRVVRSGASNIRPVDRMQSPEALYTALCPSTALSAALRLWEGERDPRRQGPLWGEGADQEKGICCRGAGRAQLPPLLEVYGGGSNTETKTRAFSVVALQLQNSFLV